MSIPSPERSRGCSLKFLLPLEDEDLAKAQDLYINTKRACERCRRRVDQSLVQEKRVKILIRVYMDEILDIIMIYLDTDLKHDLSVILPTPLVDVVLLIFHPVDMLLCVQLVTVLGHQRLLVSSSLHALRLNIIDMKYSPQVVFVPFFVDLLIKKEYLFMEEYFLKIFGHVSYTQRHNHYMKSIQGLIHIMLYYFYNHLISSINISFNLKLVFCFENSLLFKLKK